MPEMFFSTASAVVPDSTQAAIASATGDLVTATYALAAAGVCIGLLQVGVVWRGIDKMTEASEKRDKRHEDAMAAEAKRHKESMTALNALIRNSGRRSRPIPTR